MNDDLLDFEKYSDDEERDDNGRWSGGGGGGDSGGPHQAALDRWNKGGRRNAEIMHGSGHPKIAAHEEKLKAAAAKERSRAKSVDNQGLSKMSNPNLFVPITKVDVARREVWGRAAHEVPDQTDEIFDYAGSKPHFQEWSKSFSDATDGKSLGNIRAMHGKVAAGKAIAMNFDDAAKAIDIGTHIVDDNEWQKCLTGVYTGFSIGGSYVGDKTTEKMNGKDVKRYVAKPNEISLVDKPCIPTAKFFDIVKADGVIEKVAFKAVADDKPKEVTVQGTEKDVDAFTAALDANKFSMVDALEAVNLLVAKRAATPVQKTEDELIIEKAIAIGSLVKRVSDPELALVELADIAKTELTDDERKPLKTLDDVRKAIIAKVSGSMTAANKDRLQAAHDHLQAMGASCGADKSNTSGDLTKISVAALVDRIAKLEAQPAPHVVLRTIAKTVGTDPDKPKDDVKKYPDGHLAKFERPDGTIDFDAADRALTKAA